MKYSPPGNFGLRRLLNIGGSYFRGRLSFGPGLLQLKFLCRVNGGYVQVRSEVKGNGEIKVNRRLLSLSMFKGYIADN